MCRVRMVVDVELAEWAGAGDADGVDTAAVALQITDIAQRIESIDGYEATVLNGCEVQLL